MKKLVILTLILAAGLTAYPQSASRSRESKSKAKSSVSRSASKSSNSKSRSATAKSASKNRSASKSRSPAAKSSSSNRSKAAQSQSRQSSARSGTAQKSRTKSSSRKPAVRSSSSSPRSSAGRSSVAVRSSNRSDRTTSKVSTARSISSSSASRSNRTGKSTYERNDGQKFRHDNNKVFATRKYKVDFKSTADLRNSNDYRRVYNDYNRWSNNRYRRRIVVRNYYYHAPLSLEIRRVRYPYRRPVHIDLCWTPWLHQRFIYYYPMHNNWNNRYGNYIESISSYDAMHYAGSVKRVYGKVEEVYYSPEDRTYTLYFGAPFPYHDFSVVIPKRIAKEISWSPTWHFEDEYVWVVGLVDVWENKAEIVIHDEDQIRRY